jgi:AraC family transcriptional regulator
MDALINLLYKSDLFEITDFICRCTACGFSGIEYQHKCSICYIRRGSFLFKVFSAELECFNGRFLLNRPGFTHRVKHYHAQPDECIIIGFSTAFYDKIQEVYRKGLNGFLTQEDVHAQVLPSTPETEYLMYRLRHALAAKKTEHLNIDGIVLELIENIFRMQEPAHNRNMTDKQKQVFLPAIEQSREFIQENFARHITMDELARVSHMSLFHFDRAFKQIVQMSPYQYLLNFRIRHASHLLISTEEPVSSIGWSAGFNSPDHFSYAFKGKTGFSPQQYRNKKTQEF